MVLRQALSIRGRAVLPFPQIFGQKLIRNLKVTIKLLYFSQTLKIDCM